MLGIENVWEFTDIGESELTTMVRGKPNEGEGGYANGIPTDVDEGSRNSRLKVGIRLDFVTRDLKNVAVLWAYSKIWVAVTFTRPNTKGKVELTESNIELMNMVKDELTNGDTKG